MDGLFGSRPFVHRIYTHPERVCARATRVFSHGFISVISLATNYGLSPCQCTQSQTIASPEPFHSLADEKCHFCYVIAEFFANRVLGRW